MKQCIQNCTIILQNLVLVPYGTHMVHTVIFCLNHLHTAVINLKHVQHFYLSDDTFWVWFFIKKIIIWDIVKEHEYKYEYEYQTQYTIQVLPTDESTYIYIYAFSRRFYTKRLTVHSGYNCIVSMWILISHHIVKSFSTSLQLGCILHWKSEHILNII